jgi:glycerophosphoryl diester phosphodiesterase
MSMSSKAPLVLGHRGYRSRYPENTLLGFRQALANGADGVECDIQKTADRRFVVIHDPTTDRVTGVGGEIGKMRLDELRCLDFGRGERILELSELLDALPPGSFLDLELKRETLAVDDCGPLADLLDARIERKDLMVSSFAPQLLVPFRRRGFTVGFLVGKETGAGELALALIRLRPQYLNLPIQMVQRLGAGGASFLMRLFRVWGFSLLFWTVNTEGEAARVSHQARIIVTDEVERLVRLRSAWGAALPGPA